MKVSDVPQLAEFSISQDTHDLSLCAIEAWGISETPQSLDYSRISPIKLLLGQLKSTEEELQKLICSE